MPGTVNILEQAARRGPHSTAAPSPAATGQGQRIAYLISRFPKITETFILFEMLALAEQGFDVDLYSLQRERTTIMHPEAAAVMGRAQFAPPLSARVLWANWRCFASQPWTYLRTLLQVIFANLGSLRLLAGAVLFFPKAVYFARHMLARGTTHLHAHFASHPAAMAFVIRRLAGIPYSFTAHGSDLHRDSHMLREKVDSADFVVTISEFNRHWITQRCGGEVAGKIHVVHCGVDLSLFQARKRSLTGDRAAQIACVGTLHEVKGQTFLIEACRLLRDRGVRLTCHLIGDGPDRDRLRRQVDKAELADHVRFHGPLRREEIARVLQSVDLLVAPSVPTRCGRREGIPVVLMEGMASGLPVVASDISGIPELVVHERTGLLTPPRDSPRLADAIERLCKDEALRSRLAACGRSKVEADFNLARTTAELAQLFATAEVRRCGR